MANGYYNDVVAALKSRGYYYKENAKGGHEKWVHESLAAFKSYLAR